MSKWSKSEGDEARVTREALRRALDGLEPDSERMIGRVPRIMAEAERRREPGFADDWFMTAVPLARRVFPLLATATATLLLVSAGLWLNDEGHATGDRTDLAGLIMSSTSESGEDVLLQAIVGSESQDE